MVWVANLNTLATATNICLCAHKIFTVPDQSIRYKVKFEKMSIKNYSRMSVLTVLIADFVFFLTLQFLNLQLQVFCHFITFF